MTPEYWYLVVGVPLVAVAAVVVWRVWLRRRGLTLNQVLGRVAIDRVQDVLLPDGMGGQIQVEHLVLTGGGLVVIDVKAFEGAIFASERMAEWTVIGKKGRFTFPNPLGTLYDRVAALRQLVRDVPVTGLVLFNERADFLMTATSPVSESASGDKCLAHFVSGGGYSTQFILFNGVSQSTGGTLMFFSVSGAPTSFTVR